MKLFINGNEFNAENAATVYEAAVLDCGLYGPTLTVAACGNAAVSSEMTKVAVLDDYLTDLGICRTGWEMLCQVGKSEHL